MYRDKCLLRTQNFDWYISGFKEGHEEIEDDPRSGRPSTARPITEKKIEEIGKVIRKDHRFSIRAVA